MQHSHQHGDDDWGELAATRVRNVLVGFVVVLAIVTVVGLVVWWPRGESRIAEGELDFGDRVHARVAATEDSPCSFEAERACRVVTYRITSGSEEGSIVSNEYETDSGTPAAELETGDQVLLNDGGADLPLDARYSFADVQRSRAMWIVAAVFAAAVVALGRWRGLLALSGIAVSLVVILVFIFPAFLHGSHPIGVALTGASVIAFASLYLAHGLKVRTTVALLGTVVSLALTAGLAILATELASLSGLADEEALRLLAFAPDLDFRGLLLAAIIIGALGVLDDVTVTQAAAVWELRRSSPGLSARKVYSAGVRIGRDHIAATVNTLVLAYAGAAMPLLLMFAESGMSVGEVATSESVAVEIISTLVGSVGLVAAVPITTGLATWAAIRGVPTEGALGADEPPVPPPPPRPSYDLSQPALRDTWWQ